MTLLVSIETFYNRCNNVVILPQKYTTFIYHHSPVQQHSYTSIQRFYNTWNIIINHQQHLAALSRTLYCIINNTLLHHEQHRVFGFTKFTHWTRRKMQGLGVKQASFVFNLFQTQKLSWTTKFEMWDKENVKGCRSANSHFWLQSFLN